MSGLFDRLLDQPGDDDGGGGSGDGTKDSGLTPLDIVELPAHQRRIMFMLLRDKDAASNGISQEALAEKLDQPDDLAETLAELAANEWLLVLGEPPEVRYKVNLRRKRGRSPSGSLWSALSTSITNDADPGDASPATTSPEDTAPSSTTDKPPSNSDDQDDKPRRPRFPDISKW